MDDPTSAGDHRFAWCSLDPATKQVAVYPQRQSMLLESAYRAGNAQATIMVQPATMDHGLVAIVSFNDPQPGEHMQRTLAGSGERRVCRTSTLCARFGDETYNLPELNLVSFGRMAWVSVDPVQGILQPYSADNATIIEKSYHLTERRVRVIVALASGHMLPVEIRFSYATGRHIQSTGQGLRSVSRVVAETVPPEGMDIPLYQLAQNGTCDASRYRLEASADSQCVGVVTVPESAFMEEAILGTDAFCSVKLMENALLEMGYALSELKDIASYMKEEPMRVAADVCLVEYKKNSEVALLVLIDEILRAWEESKIIFSTPPDYTVVGAGDQSINGSFEYIGKHNGKPMYRQKDATAIIYFEGFWKISQTGALDNWCYSLPESTLALPGDGIWTAQGSENATPFEPPPALVQDPKPVLTEIVNDSAPDEFSMTVASLFTSWDEDSEELERLLSNTRSTIKMVMLRKVAASSLWRTIMQGA